MSPNRNIKLKLDRTVRLDGNYKGCSKLSPRLDPTPEFQSSWYCPTLKLRVLKVQWETFKGFFPTSGQPNL